jgi:hypothetical protein
VKEGNYLEKLKKAFFDLLNGDKPTLIFIVSQFAIGLLFWLAILLPFIVSPDLIGGKLSTSSLPGGTLYTLLFLIVLGLFVYLVLIDNKKAASKTFLLLAILGTLIYLYALLFNKVGLPTANNGIGKILQFLMLLLFWFFIFGKKYVYKIILRALPVAKNEIKMED